MKVEVYLSHGENEGMFKAELYLDGFRPPEAMVEDFPAGKIPEYLQNQIFQILKRRKALLN